MATNRKRPLADAQDIYHLDWEGEDGQHVLLPSLVRKRNRLLRADELVISLPEEESQKLISFLVPMKKFRNQLNLVKLSVPATSLPSQNLEYTIKDFYKPGALPRVVTPNIKQELQAVKQDLAAANNKIQNLTKDLAAASLQLIELQQQLNKQIQENQELKTRKSSQASEQASASKKAHLPKESSILEQLKQGHILTAINEIFTYLTSEENIINACKYIKNEIAKRVKKHVCQEICQNFNFPMCDYICNLVADYLQIKETPPLSSPLTESRCFVWGFVGGFVLFLALFAG